MWMRFFCILVLSLLFNSLLYAQFLKGKIINSSSKQAVNGAHIRSLSNPKLGTISNEDGSFIFSAKQINDSLLVSHINYVPQIISLKNGMLIKMEPSDNILEEVVVKPLEVNKIMSKVFENLEKNHDLGGVTYQFFYRNLNYAIDSTVNFVEEHQGLIHQNKRNSSKFKLENSRVKAFSKEGKTELADYRLIRMGMIQFDNLFKNLEDYLHHRKSKNYNFTLEDVLDFFGRRVFKISFKTDEATYYKSGYLLIDKETYAVVRNVLDGGDYKEVNFTYNAGKWYLSHSYNYAKRKDYKSEAITNYILSEKSYEPSEFSSATLLMPEKIKKIVANFDDDYWAIPNIIPLPEWVKGQIED